MTVWQRLTIAHLSLDQWQKSSYLHRVVGLLGPWRQGSVLLQWSEAIGALIVALVLSLAPFVSNALIGLLLVAGVAFWLLITLADSADGRKTSPIHWLVFLYWNVALVATALSPVKAAAFKGLTKLTLYLSFFALMARVLRNSAIRNLLITLYLHIALIVSIYGMRQWFFGADALATWVDPTSPTAKLTRVYSYLGNPNLLAAYLIPAVAFSLAAMFAWKRWLPKALASVMLITNSACLILTFSRGGWIGYVLVLGAFLLMQVFWWSTYLPPAGKKWALPIVLGGILFIVGGAVLFVQPVQDRVLSIFIGRSDSSNNFRMNVWAAVVDMIRDRPIIGIGPGNDAFNKIYPLYQRPRFTALSAYSIYLELLVEAGIVGASAFLWFLIVTFNQGLTRLAQLRERLQADGFWLMAAVAGMLGLLGHGLVDTVWYRPEVNTLWWMMVGIIASFYQPISTRSQESENPEI